MSSDFTSFVVSVSKLITESLAVQCGLRAGMLAGRERLPDAGLWSRQTLRPGDQNHLGL